MHPTYYCQNSKTKTPGNVGQAIVFGYHRDDKPNGHVDKNNDCAKYQHPTRI
jgi:hypothetical protein